jgi:hypothetical protein
MAPVSLLNPRQGTLDWRLISAVLACINFQPLGYSCAPNSLKRLPDEAGEKFAGHRYAANV